ncbi:PHP domain-containing protein [Sporosarcina sp. G11-34]|uniref:PHP domain-containing protein n=1 Tax=Sporosarcina sp. G11-34 TaxID=2849605 RepID=UPI0022A8D9FC|nr:PHP domain-containing protein [Sporosarcina sp. G11-34]MCZ2259172.1 PHP domain-containing protein [Sporosarcina sp. G11-34]
MKVDLHVHSHYSDGASSVEELMQIASKVGVTHLGLVDHDTIRGIESAQIAGKEHGIIVVRGIEISAYDFKRNRKVHILGYLFDKEAAHIQALCDPLLKRRHENSLWQIEQLQTNRFEIQLEDVVKKAKMSGVIYKQHIMDCLVDDRFNTPSYKELYQKLFKGNGICARDIGYVDAVAAVQAIKADNGYAVLAHPGQLDSFDLIPELVKNGLDGIERNHADHSEEDRERVEHYAKKYSLFQTGGSDFHGDYGPPFKLGDELSPNGLLNASFIRDLQTIEIC